MSHATVFGIIYIYINSNNTKELYTYVHLLPWCVTTGEDAAGPSFS